MMDYKSLWIDLMRYFRETKQEEWNKKEVVKVMQTKEIGYARKLPEKKE